MQTQQVEVARHDDLLSDYNALLSDYNTLSLRSELLELAAQCCDDTRLANACLVLRGEHDTIIWDEDCGEGDMAA